MGAGRAWGDDLYASTADSIVRIAADGTVSTFVSGLASPTGLAFATIPMFGDFLYVALDGPDTIVKISSAGAVNPFATIPAAQFIDPVDLLFSPLNGYPTHLYLTDLGGCGCTPGRVFRFSPVGGAFTVTVNNDASLTGLAAVSGGEFGSATILHGGVANGVSDDGAFWTVPPAGAPTVFIGTAGVFFNPTSIAQGASGAFGTDLYLGDLGAFIGNARTFFVQRRDGAGALTPFLSGLDVTSYLHGRLAFSPDGALLAVTSANAVYVVRETTDADLNGDGSVNGADLGVMLSEWGNANSPADLNCDGMVDGADLGVMLAAWG
ncbi:MAG: hypothetical protein U0575_06880 [Phycisphaerales bacterium]